MATDETSKTIVTEDPQIFVEDSDEILDFGGSFPSNPKNGFCFTLLSKGRKQQFIYDSTNSVWQEVGNDSFADSSNYSGSGGGGSSTTDTLLGTFSGVTQTYSQNISTNTGNVPQFYDIGCNSLGPFGSDVQVYANGSADDDLFVFEGSDPTIYDNWPPTGDSIWYAYTGSGITHSYSNQLLCTVPAGKIFSVMLVDTHATQVIWNGTITVRSTDTSINLSTYATSHGYSYTTYELYTINGTVRTKYGTYSSIASLPTIDLTTNITYELHGIR